MTADPALSERFSRAVDPLPIDVDERLQQLHADRRSRVVRQRVGVFALAACVALILGAIVWRLLPLGSARVPAAPSEPSGTLAIMAGSVSQPGDPFDFFDLDAFTIGAGRPPVPIERTDERASFPAWSPDGHRLAYLTGEPPRRVLVVANGDGSDPTDVAAVLTGDGFA